jgi:hypothetical membrane protein
MNNNRLVWVSGFTATVVYLICTTVAFLQYPLAYSPFENWLSDLGNPIYNPSGAFVYNLGCILVGLSLLVFSLGLRIWDDGNKRRKILLMITQVTNIISVLALIVASLFPLGQYTPIHSIAGKLHIFFAGFFLTFSATIMLRQPRIPKWFAYFGFLAAMVNFIYGAFLKSVFIAEWAAIGLFIVYVLLISANSIKLGSIRRMDGVMQR